MKTSYRFNTAGRFRTRFSAVLILVTMLAALVTKAGTHTWTGAENGDWSNPNNWVEGAPTAQENGVSLVFAGIAASQVFNIDVPGLLVDSMEISGNFSGPVELAFQGERLTLRWGMSIRRFSSGSKFIFENDFSTTAPVDWIMNGSLSVSLKGQLSGTNALKVTGSGFSTNFELLEGPKSFQGRIEASLVTVKLGADLPDASLVFTTKAELKDVGQARRLRSLRFLGTGETFHLSLSWGLILDELVLASSVYWNFYPRGTTPYTEYPVIKVATSAELNMANLDIIAGFEIPDGIEFLLIDPAPTAKVLGRIGAGFSAIEEGLRLGMSWSWYYSYSANGGRGVAVTLVDSRRNPGQSLSAAFIPDSGTVGTCQYFTVSCFIKGPGAGSADGWVEVLEEGRRVSSTRIEKAVALPLCRFDRPGRHELTAVFHLDGNPLSITSAPMVINVTNRMGQTLLPLPRWAPPVPRETMPSEWGIRSLCMNGDRTWFIADFTVAESATQEFRIGWIAPDERIAHRSLAGDSPKSGSSYSRLVVSSDRALWFGDTTDGTLWRYVPGAAGAARFPLGPQKRIVDIAGGRDGLVWLLLQDNATSRFALGSLGTNGVIREYQTPESVREMSGMTTGGDGSVWMSGRGNLVRSTTNGVFEIVTLPSSLKQRILANLAVATNGTVWGHVERGRFTGCDAGRNWHEASVPYFPNFEVSVRSAVPHPDGSVWFSGDYVLGRLTPWHTIELFATDSGSTGLAVAGDGRLVTAGNFNAATVTFPGLPTRKTFLSRASVTPARNIFRMLGETIDLAVDCESDAMEKPSGYVLLHNNGGQSRMRLLDEGRLSTSFSFFNFEMRAIFLGDAYHFASGLPGVELRLEQLGQGDTSMTADPLTVRPLAGAEFEVSWRAYTNFEQANEFNGEVLLKDEEGRILGRSRYPGPPIKAAIARPGIHELQVVFPGDAGFAPSKAEPFSVEVVSAQPIPAKVGLVSAPGSNGAPKLKLTAQVDNDHGRPGGLMYFYEGADLMGMSVVRNGRAELVIDDIAGGFHTFNARYTGDRSFLAAQSDELRVEVRPQNQQAPRLEVARIAGSLHLRWNNSIPGYRLQKSSSVSVPRWEVAGPAEEADGMLSVQIPFSAQNQFFRLIKE